MAMALKASMRCLSELEPRVCHLPSEEDKKPEEVPLGLDMTVESPPSERSGFTGPPTRAGSWSLDSFAKVRHSEVSSMEWASNTSPHSEHMVSPAEWSNTTSVSLLQSRQNKSAIFFFFWCVCVCVCFLVFSGSAFFSFYSIREEWRVWRCEDFFRSLWSSLYLKVTNRGKIVFLQYIYIYIYIFEERIFLLFCCTLSTFFNYFLLSCDRSCSSDTSLYPNWTRVMSFWKIKVMTNSIVKFVLD